MRRRVARPPTGAAAPAPLARREQEGRDLSTATHEDSTRHRDDSPIIRRRWYGYGACGGCWGQSDGTGIVRARPRSEGRGEATSAAYRSGERRLPLPPSRS
jgi:hypothetical protein